MIDLTGESVQKGTKRRKEWGGHSLEAEYDGEDSLTNLIHGSEKLSPLLPPAGAALR